jgi:transposase
LAPIKDRNAPQKPVWRGQIVLLTADGVGANEIMRETGKSTTCLWRRQERFADEGFDGPARDTARASRVKPLAAEIVARVAALTRDPPPGETARWTGALMAKTSGVSISSVQRLWRKHGFQSRRMRQFKLSHDPKFIEKLRDVVGLYGDPPARAIVLSLDEKSPIQALDGVQPGLPLKKGRAGAMTHDDIRHGATTLLAAMNSRDGTIVGQNMRRRRRQEFIRFLNATESVLAARAKRRFKRGLFRSVVDARTAIDRFLEERNQKSAPFAWIADPNRIIAAVRRGRQASDSIH